MYLHGERCANCGGKFDDTYKTEPYNTILNPYRVTEPWPWFCSERCKDGAIARKEIVTRHEKVFDAFEESVYRDARDYSRSDIERTQAEAHAIGRALRQEIDAAAKTRDESISHEITQRYTTYFQEYARLNNERMRAENQRLIDGEASFLETPRTLRCTVDDIKKLTPVPPVYEQTLNIALMTVRNVIRKGAFYSEEPASAFAELIKLCTQQIPKLAHVRRQTNALPVADVSALDASADPHALIRAAYDLFQSTAEGHDTLTRFYLRRFVRGTPQMTDDELWKRVAPSIPAKDLADIVFGGSAFGPNMILQREAPVEIEDKTRYEHTHILAPTGAGKTTLMQRDILTDLGRDNPPGMIIVEPKGTMCARIRSLAAVHTLRDRLIVIDATDAKRLPALNLFAPLGHEQGIKARIESHTIDLLAYIFTAGDFALTAKQMVGFSFLARLLFKTPNANLSSLLKLVSLTPQQFASSEFAKVIPSLDTVAQHFFAHDFFKGFSETKEQIKSRLYLVMHSPELRAMFDAPRRSIDWFDVIQQRKIVLVNTGSGLLDEATHQIIGRYVIASVVAAAAGRAAIPKTEWHPCFLYIDEANLFMDPVKTERMLSISREFHLGITLAHTLMTSVSMTETIRASLSTNTAIKYAASVEGSDLRAAAQDLRCDPAFIRSQTVTDTHVNFACFVRNHPYGKAFTSSALIGNVEAQPQSTEDDVSYLLDENQHLYCEEDVRDLEEHPVFDAEPATVRPQDDPDYF